MHLVNIVPYYEGNQEYTIGEILRQHREVGLTDFGLSFSFHPVGDCAYDLIGKLCGIFEAIRRGVSVEPGIRLGILWQSFLGHGWSGPVPLTSEPWQHTVTADGQVSSRMCPLDPSFRAYVLEVVDRTMALKPAFVFLDDDFCIKPDECFCPLHVKAFNEKHGTRYSQQELMALYHEKAEDDPEILSLSRQWGDILIDLAKEMRAVMDRHDPDCVCTVCCPYMGHGFELGVAQAMANRQGFSSMRVNNAVYGGNQPQDLLYASRMSGRLQEKLRGISEYLDEADTFPQNYMSESAVLFRGHLTTAALTGLNGAKLWTSDFDTMDDPGSQKRYELVIRDWKPYWDALCDTVKGIRWQGVRCLIPGTRNPLHPAKASRELYGCSWEDWVFGRFAIPCHHGGPQEGVTAITGRDVDYSSDEELKALFHGRVLVEASAVKALTARGFSQWLGVRSVEDADFFFQGEAHAGDSTPSNLMWEAAMAKLVCMNPAVTVASWCTRGCGRGSDTTPVSPCMTFFVNEFGGKVACLAWPMDMASHKLHRESRRRFLMEALDFLSDGCFEMAVDCRHAAVLRHGILPDGQELVGIVSLGLDEVPEVRIRTPRTPKGILMLQQDGSWKPVEWTQEGNWLTVPTPLRICEGKVFKMRF